MRRHCEAAEVLRHPDPHRVRSRVAGHLTLERACLVIVCACARVCRGSRLAWQGVPHWAAPLILARIGQHAQYNLACVCGKLPKATTGRPPPQPMPHPYGMHAGCVCALQVPPQHTQHAPERPRLRVQRRLHPLPRQLERGCAGRARKCVRQLRPAGRSNRARWSALRLPPKHVLACSRGPAVKTGLAPAPSKTAGYSDYAPSLLNSTSFGRPGMVSSPLEGLPAPPPDCLASSGTACRLATGASRKQAHAPPPPTTHRRETAGPDSPWHRRPDHFDQGDHVRQVLVPLLRRHPHQKRRDVGAAAHHRLQGHL